MVSDSLSAAGDLTDVPGIAVGHWSDPEARTGCTVVLLPPDGAVTAVDVRGAAPGTRETDLLDPSATVQVAHAVLLAGGSAFGLAAADGVMAHLEALGRGVPTAGGPVPIVPAAVLYDLTVGSARVRPDAAAGLSACRAAEDGRPCGSGRLGAGTGATVGKLLGQAYAVDGGLGTASRRLPGGGVVGAVVAVNAVGDVVAEDGRVLAGADTTARLLRGDTPDLPVLGTNTTLAVVATDLILTQAEARRLAVAAHDGLAHAIRPVHTSFDGDTVFAVSTGLGATPDQWGRAVLEVAAAEVLADAIRAAVR